MNISQAVDLLADATEAAGLSDHTVIFYRRKLKPLVIFLADKTVEDVTLADLRTFVASQRRRTTRWNDHPNRSQKSGGLSEATIAGHIRATKRLFRFLQEEGIIEKDPSARLKQMKPKRGKPKAASMADLKTLLTKTDGNDKLAKRNRALLLVMADTACRVAGLTGMRVNDVDLNAGKIYLHEKGDKGRYAFMTLMTQAAIEAWIEVRPVGTEDHLWTKLDGKGGGQLTCQGVREMLRRLKIKAGVTGRVNPHAWRHAFAREYLMNGGDMGTLADIMGHSDVSVTHASYAIFLTEELKIKHTRHSPLANMEFANSPDTKMERATPMSAALSNSAEYTFSPIITVGGGQLGSP